MTMDEEQQLKMTDKNNDERWGASALGYTVNLTGFLLCRRNYTIHAHLHWSLSEELFRK